jgi:MoxR-like ATPase
MSERHLPPVPTGLLRDLGVVGWDNLEPVILAAVASESPLLLVGPHGTAKSLLLERLASALGLAFRHYNASTLNFDDLAGFPVPDGDAVRYLRTPLDAWDAEAVFVDELSRCRPDQQNRLFPLIHERRLQGRPLERLRHRWAAMNPPPSLEAAPEDERYLGAEPLDAALADRFPWVIAVPDRLGADDRRALIRGPAVSETGAEALRAEVAAVRGRRALVAETYGEQLVGYVDAAALALARAGLHLSLRRLRQLHDNLVSLLATERYADPADAARVALSWSLPQRAGRALTEGEEEAILRAHKLAESLVNRPLDRLRRALLEERDPLRRVGLALESADVDLVAATLSDARASLGPAERLGLSVRLFPVLAEGWPGLPGWLFEALAKDLARTALLQEHTTALQTSSPRHALHVALTREAAQLSGEERWIAEVLWAAFRDELELDPARLVRTCRALVGIVPTVEQVRARRAAGAGEAA